MQGEQAAFVSPRILLASAPHLAARGVALSKMTLAGQFLLANLIVLLASMAVVGTWVGMQIEAGVLDHTASTSAFYVNSVLTPHLEGLATSHVLSPEEIENLDGQLMASLHAQNVVAFKVWGTDGTILYSPTRDLIGRRYPIDQGLADAIRGVVTAEVSSLDEPENEFEREHFDSLLSVYAPVRSSIDGQVIAVTEFYMPPDELKADIAEARARSWLIVGAVTAAAYMLLAGIVKRGSDTIVRQQRILRRQIGQLSELNKRVTQAAERTTALNEQALRRISADLHDGPGQALALALLRLDSLKTQSPESMGQDFDVVQGAVRDAMAELRAISASLRLPELDSLSVAEIAERAVNDHQRRTGADVQLRKADLPQQAPLALKIAVLRTLQEALSNATRHGGQSAPIDVLVRRRHEVLDLLVSDKGQGFDTRAVSRKGRLGLVGMRERAELLGGTFEVRSRAGKGTVVHACWPLAQGEQHA